MSGGLSEEEQMMRAIALSLELGEGESSSGSNKQEGEVETKESSPEPLDSRMLGNFAAQLMTNCLKLIDTIPDVVHKLCSLFTAVGRRNGLEWQQIAMIQLRDQVFAMCVHQGLCHRMILGIDPIVS